MRSKDVFVFDDNTLAAFREGDAKVFAAIYNSYWKKLLNISYRHLQDKSLAESVVQEVFISLWNRRDIIQIDSLEAYLATAVKYSTLKFIQRNKRHAELEMDSVVSDFCEEDQQIEVRFLKDHLNAVVDTLPEKCRLIFKLSRESHMTNVEISQSLSISEKTVEAHITRALKTLRMNLQKVGFSILLYFFI